MQYELVSTREVSQLAWPIFEVSFQTFLGERTRAEFERVLQDYPYVSLLKRQGQLIAFCFHREIQCLSRHKPPSYLRDAPEIFLKMIEGRKRFLSMEWLAVHPDHLGKFTKVQPVDLILGAALKSMNESDYDGAIGFSRQDIRTDRMTERFGSRKMGEVIRFELTCSLVFMWRGELKPHPIGRTQDTIDDIWNHSKQNVLCPAEAQRKVAL